MVAGRGREECIFREKKPESDREMYPRREDLNEIFGRFEIREIHDSIDS